MDPTEKLLHDAMTQFPTQYRGLMDYLTLREAVPEVVTNVKFKPGPNGEVAAAKFMYPTAGKPNPDLGPAGMAAFSGGAGPSELLHELTHAAQRAMHAQAQEGKTSANVKRAIEQLGFTGGPWQSKESKMHLSDGTLQYGSRGVKEQSRKLAPGFETAGNTPAEKEWSNYRTSTPELAAWAMGNMTLPPDKKSVSPAPLHHDATLASELEILLDLATRDMKSRKRK